MEPQWETLDSGPQVVQAVAEQLAPDNEVALASPSPEPSPQPVPRPENHLTQAASDLPPGSKVAAGTVSGAGVGTTEADLPPARVPPSVRLLYTVKALSKGANTQGSGRLDWSHDGQTYQASLTAKILFFTVMSQTSTGRLSDKGIAPERFTDSRRSGRAAHFERSTGKIRYSNNAPDAALLPGAQDRLTVNFQLSALFNARPDAYSEGQTLRLPVSSHDLAEVWLFRVGPTSHQTLPAGEIVTRQLTRSPRKEFDRKVDIWLAPAMAHLPVRLRITEPSGDFLDMQLEELPQLPALEKPLHP